MKCSINKEWYCSADSVQRCDHTVHCAISGRTLDDSVYGGCKKCVNYHRKHPTPLQFLEEYGEEYPDEGAVYFNSDGDKTIGWAVGIYGNVSSDFEYIVCACTPWGKPPDDWRPV
jgi:hypothetical protein